MNILRAIWYKFLQPLGIGLFIFWIVVGGATIVFDGHVIDLPNHKVIIADYGYHFYPKALTVEYKAEEQE